MVASAVTHLALYAALSRILPAASIPGAAPAERVLRVAFPPGIAGPASPGRDGQAEPPRPAPRPAAEPATVTAPRPAPEPAAPIATVVPAAGTAVSANDERIPAAAGGDRTENAAGPDGDAGPDPAIVAGEEFKRRFSSALVYPEAARRAGKTGSVSLTVTIGAGGDVVSIGVSSSSGSALLDAAAREAAGAASPLAAPGRQVRLAIRAVFSAGMASLGD